MLEEKLERLRQELNDKHAQNRRDIHDLRNEQQEMLDRQHSLDLKLVPVLGNGMPGLVTKVDEIVQVVQDIRLEQAANATSRDTLKLLLQEVNGLKTSANHQAGVLGFLRAVGPQLLTLISLLIGIWAVLHKG